MISSVLVLKLSANLAFMRQEKKLRFSATAIGW